MQRSISLFLRKEGKKTKVSVGEFNHSGNSKNPSQQANVTAYEAEDKEEKIHLKTLPKEGELKEQQNAITVQVVIRICMLNLDGTQTVEMEIGSSNDDIPTEVLSRLPSETLLGLKCVSKGWHRLISDLSFIRTQLERSQAISGFFFQERFNWCDEDIASLSHLPVGMEQAVVQNTILDFLPENVVLKSSSNGLLCCRSCLPAQDPVIYVCNPSTKEWVKLNWAKPDKKDSLALAFSPLSHPVDICTDFKVVSIHQTETETDSYLAFEIYSSETGAWKTVEEAYEYSYNLFKNHGIFASGFLHWLTDGDQILVFNIEKEQIQLIELPYPTVPCKDIPEMCIGESGGYLHYIRISMAGLQVWILENYAEDGWVLKCSLSLEDLERENPQFLYKVSLKLARRTTTDEIPWMDPLAFQDDLLFMRVSSKVYLLQIETRKMKELCTLTKLGRNSLVCPTVLPYSMSLVPLGPH